VSLADSAVAVQAIEAVRRRDPLRSFRFAVPRFREAFSLFTAADPIDELHARGPNGTGKTLTASMYVTACAQKRRELDGIPIPQWRGRVECLQLVLDFPQQLLSVKAAYQRAIGDWPNHPRYNGEHLTSIHVMPLGGDPIDESDWSVIYFMSQKNMQAGTGARADVIHFDEPPRMDFLRELRKAAHAGRRSIILIGETPTKRREWAPLREDYGDTPRRTLRRVDRERAEVRWSLDEVDSWLLPDDAKEKLRRKYATDPLRAAREHGDYANTEGKCPFDDVTIMKMIDEWCREPELKQVRVAIESPDGEPHAIERIPVQVWQMPKRGQDCYQCIDPASGVDDDAHNPAAIHLSDDDTGELLARWNGYLAPYSVGALAAAIHRHYNGASTDVEMKDHWGVNVVRGYQENDGANLCYEQRELRPGVWAKEVGFDVDQETRAIWIGQIQEWIAAFRAGTPYAVCRSREVFECLLDTELDDRGRVVAGPGIAHGEDMVLLGQKLRRVIRPHREAPQVYVPPQSAEEATAEANRELARMIRGADADDLEPEVLRPTKDAPRW